MAPREVPMQASRPDRVIRILSAIASVAYFTMWACAALVLIALPAIKMFGTDGNFFYNLELPVTAPNLGASVQTVWGPAPLTLDKVRAQLQLPIPMLPWSLVAVLWSYAAIGAALLLLFLKNLRRIF